MGGQVQVGDGKDGQGLFFLFLFVVLVFVLVVHESMVDTESISMLAGSCSRVSSPSMDSVRRACSFRHAAHSSWPGTTGFSPHSEHSSIISNCSVSPRTSRRHTEHILSVSFM